MADDREVVSDENEMQEQAPGNGEGETQDEAPTNDMEALRQEIDSLRSETEELMDKYRRALADFSNFRKRQERDREVEVRRMSMDVLRQFLPIIDDFRRANENVPQPLADSEWVAGVRLVERKIEKLLEQFGVEPIEAEGKHFDPHYHSALMQEESDEYPAGIVIQDMQRGYMMGDDVLRPTMVKVSGGPGPE
jgi:molecular chaperone GrpE